MDTLFLGLSKVAWSLIAPESLLLWLVLLAWMALLRGATRWAKRFLGLALAGLLSVATFPVGEWVLYPLEDRFPANPPLPQRVDGIIVLGGAEDAVRSAAWGQPEVYDSAERFLASIALIRRYPEAKLVFTSGSGSVLKPEAKGTAVARQLYESQGLDLARVILESQSRNTFENAAFSKALAKPAPGEVWVLVTSASHMPRSVGVFCKAGWAVVPYPVDHQTVRGNIFRIDTGLIGNLGGLSTGIKEWVGLAVYYLTGRTSALYPSGCPA